MSPISVAQVSNCWPAGYYNQRTARSNNDPGAPSAVAMTQVSTLVLGERHLEQSPLTAWADTASCPQPLPLIRPLSMLQTFRS